MCDLETAGLLLQISGLLIILGSQIWLWYRARKKWGSESPLKKLFIGLSGARQPCKKEKIPEMSKAETDEMLRKFPSGEYLYDDLLTSGLGALLALIGTVFELIG